MVYSKRLYFYLINFNHYFFYFSFVSFFKWFSKTFRCIIKLHLLNYQFIDPIDNIHDSILIYILQIVLIEDETEDR
jgi:hypothetical protein